MKQGKIFVRLSTVLALLVACSSVSYAQATRTWVSGVGDDANPCSRTAPCKTFPGAISKTATGGEINIIDQGSYGSVTITKSITISGEGQFAGILAAGVSGIIINAPAGSAVTLRHLDLNGFGTGLNGIRFIGGSVLHIENCVIDGFRGGAALGIDISPTTAGTAQVYIKDTIVRNNGTGNIGGGIQFKPGAGASVKASLDNVRTENNVFGVKAQDNSTVSVSDSVAAGNGFAGFSAVQAGTGAISMTVSNSTSVNNGTVGVLANGNSATIVRITNVTTTGNGTGWQAVGGAQLISFGNNNNDGNGTNGASTINIGQD